MTRALMSLARTGAASTRPALQCGASSRAQSHRCSTAMHSLSASNNRFLIQANGIRAFSTAAATEKTADEARMKMLMYRAQQRGWLELDILLGEFAEKKLPGFTSEQLDQFEDTLELENPDLFKWLTFQAPLPAELADNVMLNEVLKFVEERKDTSKPFPTG